jgi:peptidoglycan hydrolase CwlO-like protein
MGAERNRKAPAMHQNPQTVPAAATRINRRSFIAAAACALAGCATGLACTGARRALGDEGYSASAETEAALADAEYRYEQAVAQLNYLNDQVFQAEIVYNQITDDLNATIQAIADLQADIEQRQVELAEAQDVLAERVAASYRAGNASMLEVLLEATDFDDLLTRVYYAGKISDSDAQIIQTVKDIKAQLEADQAALREQQATQEQLLAEQAAQIEVLNSQVYAAESYAASLDSEVQALIAQRNAEIAAAAEAARIAAEEEAARQAAEAAAAASGTGGGDYSDSGDFGYTSSGSGGSSYTGTSSGSNAGAVGNAYSLIGTSYSTLDCSGLTSTAYGGSIPHSSSSQYSLVVSNGNLVGASGLSAGDLVFYERNGSIYHVGLYIGDGMIIDSIPSGGVQVRDLYFCDGFCGGGSPY